MEFKAESFAKGAPGKVHQLDGAPTAAEGDTIIGRKFTDDLAVSAEDGGWGRTNDFDVDGRAEGQDQRTIRQGMGANGSQGENLCGREHNGAASSQ